MRETPGRASRPRPAAPSSPGGVAVRLTRLQGPAAPPTPARFSLAAPDAVQVTLLEEKGRAPFDRGADGGHAGERGDGVPVGAGASQPQAAGVSGWSASGSGTGSARGLRPAPRTSEWLQDGDSAGVAEVRPAKGLPGSPVRDASTSPLLQEGSGARAVCAPVRVINAPPPQAPPVPEGSAAVSGEQFREVVERLDRLEGCMGTALDKLDALQATVTLLVQLQQRSFAAPPTVSSPERPATTIESRSAPSSQLRSPAGADTSAAKESPSAASSAATDTSLGQQLHDEFEALRREVSTVRSRLVGSPAPTSLHGSPGTTSSVRSPPASPQGVRLADHTTDSPLSRALFD